MLLRREHFSLNYIFTLSKLKCLCDERRCQCHLFGILRFFHVASKINLHNETNHLDLFFFFILHLFISLRKKEL